MAAAATAGLDDGSELPAGFWDHAAATANATQLVAPRYMVPGGDGFALGLLHDLGTALLCRANPEQWEIISANGEHPEAEREVYGLPHPEVEARLFEMWHLSPKFTHAREHTQWRRTDRGHT